MKLLLYYLLICSHWSYSAAEDAVFDDSFESLVPLIVVLFMGMTTGMVELTLFFGIFVGACMVKGNVEEGFKSTLETYILNALEDIWHGYVYLFTFFIAGFTAMLQKSGGLNGFANILKKYATSSMTGQLACMLAGCIIFFDDYTNCLVAGTTMRPVVDLLSISREKLAFIVDATAAPIASLVPLSSWIGFEVGLIQDEIDKIIEKTEGNELSIETTGYAVFLESIKYRYYSIFMLFFIPLLIISKRDFGPMVVAERKVVVYKRKDGGDGAAASSSEFVKGNEPSPDTPVLAMNLFVPLFFLVFFIFYILVDSGDDGTGEQSFMDKIKSSDSYVALLHGTMAAALLAAIFYIVQPKKDGKLAVPTPSYLLHLVSNSNETCSYPVPLMTIEDTVESFIFGMSKIFRALIVLTLAWGISAVMQDVGADKYIGKIIKEDVDPGLLPTISYIVSAFIALCIGTSWGTMGIVFPLMAVPAYEASNGDPRIFYATVAGILAGSITGVHAFISDTTVLSSLACECDLLAHVKTQYPYTGLVALWSVLVGTLPIGLHSNYPNGLAIFLGLVFLGISVFLLGVPVLNESGKFDIGTEIYLKFTKNHELVQLKEDTISAFKSSGAKGALVEETSNDGDEEDGVEKAVETSPDEGIVKPTPIAE